jgi:hypothetical protein
MSLDQTEARTATYDQLDLQIQTAEAKLETLKAWIDAARENFEGKAVAQLVAKRQVIQKTLQDLKKASIARRQWGKAALRRPA